jgi:hypothetical protein
LNAHLKIIFRRNSVIESMNIKTVDISVQYGKPNQNYDTVAVLLLPKQNGVNTGNCHHSKFLMIV